MPEAKGEVEIKKAIESSTARMDVTEEVGVGDKDLDEYLAEVRCWLGRQPHLPQNVGDNLLKSFIVGCKLDVGRAENRLDLYFTARSQYRDLFANRDLSGASMAAANKFWYLFDLENCTPEGYTATFIVMQEAARLRDNRGVASPSDGGSGVPERKVKLKLESVTSHYIDLYRKILMLVDLRLRDRPLKTGDLFVVDMAGASMAHMLALSPGVLHRLARTVLECNPVRLKGIIMFNMPYILSAAMNKLIRPIIKKKMAKRLFLYSCGAECLVKHFKLCMLPTEFGGSNKTISQLHENCFNNLVKNQGWFLTEGSLTSDESQRPEVLKKHGNCLIS